MCWALTDLLARCPVADDPPVRQEERKGQTAPKQVVRGAVLMLPAEVTSREVSSRAVSRRSHTTGRSGSNHGSSVVPAPVCLMKMQEGIAVHSFLGCAAVLGAGVQQ